MNLRRGSKMDIYAYKNTPEVIEKSSSGGAFSKIANIFSDQYKDNYSDILQALRW